VKNRWNRVKSMPLYSERSQSASSCTDESWPLGRLATYERVGSRAARWHPRLRGGLSSIGAGR
jgi:hypothetical protein